jgi:ParB-like partition proteins
MAKQRGLGKGLASLIPTDQPEAQPAVEEAAPLPPENEPAAQEFAWSALSPNPLQPRKTIGEAELVALAESIKTHGVIQPILVRPHLGAYQIVAGERRWRAARMAGLERVPVHVMDLDDAAALEIALIENLQREDLSVVETARGIQELIDTLAITHEEVAARIGMSRAAVTNKLRLLQLPEEVLALLEREELTEGHARALLSLPSVAKILEYAKITVEKGLNVRDLEHLVRNAAMAEKLDAMLPKKGTVQDDFQAEVERLNAKYKLDVRVGGSRKNMGVTIKGLKKWQIQLLLEYIEENYEELFPRE